jgi:hypothetical protein
MLLRRHDYRVDVAGGFDACGDCDAFIWQRTSKQRKRGQSLFIDMFLHCD